MKIEKRGKYPGVKVHLEPDEVKLFMKVAEGQQVANGGMKIEVPTYLTNPTFSSMVLKLGGKLINLVKEEPDTLSERTPEQVAEVVALELKTATQKMEALKGGKDWKHFTKAEAKG